MSANTPSDGELPIMLRPSRGKAVRMLLVSVACLSVSLWVAQEHALSGYFGVAFCLIASVVFTLQLVPGSSYLRLTSDGFTFCSLYRSHTVQWQHAGEFGVAHLGTKKLVGWNPSVAYKSSGLATASKAISGYIAALPDTYGQSAEGLCELLNSLRSRYGSERNI